MKYRVSVTRREKNGLDNFWYFVRYQQFYSNFYQQFYNNFYQQLLSTTAAILTFNLIPTTLHCRFKQSIDALQL